MFYYPEKILMFCIKNVNLRYRKPAIQSYVRTKEPKDYYRWL